MKQAYIEAVVYNRNKNVTEEILKTLLKSFIWFHSANKIDNYNSGGEGWKKERKNPEKSTEQVKREEPYMFILSHCCQSPFPHLESQSTSPP